MSPILIYNTTGGIMRLLPHEASKYFSNLPQSAPDATELDTNNSTLHSDTQQQQEMKAGLPQYHINGVELRWSPACNIIPQYPIRITGLKDTKESTVVVKDQVGLDQLVMHVKWRRCGNHLEKDGLEPVDVFDGLGCEEKQRGVIFEEYEGCKTDWACEDEDDDEEVDVVAPIFVQVDVLSATDAAFYEDDEDAATEFDEEIGVRPCVGRQYVWQV